MRVLFPDMEKIILPQSGLPFDDIRNLAADLPGHDEDALALTRSQLKERNFKNEPKLAGICEWYSAWSGRSPAIRRPLVTLFAGTHTLDNEIHGASASDFVLEEVTSIASGDSLINRLCHQHGAGLKVFDLALQIPVADISKEAALDEKGCAGTIAFGMEAIAGGADLLCISGIEKTASLSNIAILCLLAGLEAGDLLPNSKQAVERVEKALVLSKSHKHNPLEVLRRMGGRETAATCGAILAARSQHVPVLLAGYPALAAACILHALNPDSLGHCMFAQQSGVPAINRMLVDLNLDTVLEKPLSGNPASGVVLAFSVVQSACLLLQEKA